MKFLRTSFVVIFLALVVYGCSGVLPHLQFCSIDCSNTEPQEVGTVTDYKPGELIQTHCWNIDLTKLPELLPYLLTLKPEEIIGQIIYVTVLEGQGCLGQDGGGKFMIHSPGEDKDNTPLVIVLPGSAFTQRE